MEMSTLAAKTVRELALEIPHATRVFETLGIDYCCGGRSPLEAACLAKNLSLEEVIGKLEAAARPAPTTGENWQAGSLAGLIDHLIATHHKFTREEIARLQPLLDKVCKVHGKNHPELLAIRDVFQALAQELTVHLMKEEMVLFPYIVRMEESVLESQPVLPAPFGSVENPVRAMMTEHDGAGEALRKMRKLSAGYAAPVDACISFQTLYQALAGFEADLHQHIHLENNILFPRALEIENPGR
jgi:regulator of cell morphogenesis and NO signaling